MKFSLVICTYMRPKPIIDLLESVRLQTLYPDEILIIDGSVNDATRLAIGEKSFEKLQYFQVDPKDRGLTRQRNFGISKVGATIEIVCFLDDDTILENNYFEEIIKTFVSDETIVGVGGIAINENKWEKLQSGKSYDRNRFYEFDGYVYPEGLRNIIRNYLGLESDLPPGRMPEYSHGKTCSFPPNGKTYEVDLLIGMSFSFRKKVYQNSKFSTYFEGYGLYEDADYSIRAQKLGRNVINTKAQLSHFHDPSGRPNKYEYGKMVVRNGWYVWRVKYPNPSFKAQLKWHSITLLLALIRLTNVITTSERKEAFKEFLGRIAGWMKLLFVKPKRER